MQIRDKIYLNGKWIPSRSSNTLAVNNVATGQMMTRVPDATVENVDNAIAAARGARPGHSRECERYGPGGFLELKSLQLPQ